MFKNYFNIAIRNLFRHKSYTIINTLSLVVGITCFVFLMLYVKYELTYDSFHKKENRIYQVGLKFTEGDFLGYKSTSFVAGALAPALKREFPEIEHSIRVKQIESPIYYADNGFIAKGIYADGDFFNVFSFYLKKGDIRNALQNPNTMVISESLAAKLFGNEDPIGKVVKQGAQREYNVTAVVKDPPENTNLKFEFIVSFTTLTFADKNIENNWEQLDWPSYVLLKENVPFKEFERKLARIVEKYHSSNVKKREYFLIPIDDVHFSAHMLTDTKQGADKKFIYLLIFIACIVLIIGCINYMNLTTARAGTRSKEVGIRKTVGANRMQLMKQFLSESFLVTFLSIIMSVLFICATFPYFKEIAGNGIQLSILSNWTTIIGLIGLFIVVGLISGSYPAFILSSMKPVSVLKSAFQTNLTGKHLKFRNLLVVFQFCITIVLVLTAIVVQKQLHFVKNSDIGYRRDEIVSVKIRGKEIRSNYKLIKNDLMKNANIKSTAFASIEPISARNIGPIKIENESGEMKDVDGMTSHYYVDSDYFSLFNIKIIKGRGFSQEYLGNVTREVVINETAARLAGIFDPVGKKLERGGEKMEIIGVVKDFHFASLKTKIDPLMLTFNPEGFNATLVKISDLDVSKTLPYINTIFKKYNKSFIFDYSFVSDLYNKLYKKETELGGLILSFSIITIAIASIGLFGLISFIVGRKTKEIGVRKILGASVMRIVWLIVKEFFLLLVIALVIALPAAYYLANSWLQDFVYRIDISIWMFVLATSIIVLVAFLSISQQVVKAAIANPVDSLRSE